MMTPDEIKAKNQRFNNLCRNVFSGGEGAELMEFLIEFFVDVQLYDESDRKTIYNVAQRDLIMELKSHIKPPATNIEE